MVCTACLIKSFLLLFIALDAPGNAPLFYFFTQEFSRGLRRRIIIKSTWVALAILIVFVVSGDVLLRYFGLTLADFRIAGGIILLIYGIRGILGYMEAQDIREHAEAESIAIVPLATPLLAGPAAIATVLYINAAYGLFYALASIVVNIVITYILLSKSEELMRLLGKSGAIALSKLMAILLAAIAISMIRSGIIEIVMRYYPG